MLFSNTAYCATMYFAPTSTASSISNQSTPVPCWTEMKSDGDSTVFNCICASATGSTTCHGNAQIKVTYTSKTKTTVGGTSIWKLTGCQVVGCGCENDKYYNGTSDGCKVCSKGPTGYQFYAAAPSIYNRHSNTGSTSCKYCAGNEYYGEIQVAPSTYVGSCYPCETGATSDGTGDHTSCCYPSGTTGSDTTGSFQISNGKCCWEDN